MSNKKRHSESGRTRNQRREHDRKERAYETAAVQPWHGSPIVRIGIAVVAVVTVVSITLLFLSGAIKW